VNFDDILSAAAKEGVPPESSFSRQVKMHINHRNIDESIETMTYHGDNIGGVTGTNGNGAAGRHTSNNCNNRASTNLENMRRVILLGDSQVGKTSIVKRIVDEQFNKEYDKTINYDFVSAPL